jgi:hypothetical protein
MRRQRKRVNQTPTKAKRGGNQSPDGDPSSEGSSRRDLLLKARNGLIAVAVIGGAGWYMVEEVRAVNREQDLSMLGNGVATVVQIHDPQCPKCTALQREARDAMDGFEASEIQFLVANIRTDEGRGFARKHGVGHVTLLLFDGKGKRLDTLVGPNTAKNLERVFRRHISRSKQS